MKRNLMASALLLASVVFLTACPQETTIARLNADPGRYYDREIALKGTVTNSFGAFGPGVYELSDETGRIIVVTDRGVPSKGARIQVAGKYVNGVTWGGRNYGAVLREMGRRAR
jgi:hypothetical protein